jgi:adenylyl-sulfate kinase
MARVDRHFEAMLVWMDENDMNPSTHYYIKHSYNNTKVRFDKIQYKVNVNTLEREEATAFTLNEIGRVVMTTVKPLIFDPYKVNKETGSFILIDPVTNNTCAVGMIIDKLGVEDLPSRITEKDKEKIKKGQALISTEERIERLGQKAATIWITGLHGSGKNELAYTLERKMFDMGASVVLMDGSTVRSGLSCELDYSPADRAEHLRRVAHVARLLNDQGIIVISSFISPYNDIRQQIGELIGKDNFHVVYMDADLEYCKKTLPELYEKAERGEKPYMPGIDERFEIPENPALVLDPKNTEKNSDIILDFLNKKNIFPAK